MNDNTVYVIDARRYSRNGEIIEHNVHVYSSYQNIIAAFKPFFEVPNKEVHMNGKNEMLQVRIFDPANEFVTKYKFDIYEKQIDNFFPKTTEHVQIEAVNEICHFFQDVRIWFQTKIIKKKL